MEEEGRQEKIREQKCIKRRERVKQDTRDENKRKKDEKGNANEKKK